MEDRQHCTVVDRIEELVRMPARRERTCFGFAVADDACGNEIGSVEDRAVRVYERVSELAAFVNRSRRFRRGMTRNPTRKRELLEQLPHPLGIRRDVRIHLAVRPFE